MKITLKQLKQLIREQVEENVQFGAETLMGGGDPYAFEPGAALEALADKWEEKGDRDMAKFYRKAAKETRKLYRELEQSKIKGTPEYKRRLAAMERGLAASEANRPYVDPVK